MVPQNTPRKALSLSVSRDHATHDFFRRKYTSFRVSASETPLKPSELGVTPPVVSTLNASLRPEPRSKGLMK